MSQRHELLPARTLALTDDHYSIGHLSNPPSMFQKETAAENKRGKGGTFG